MCTESIPNKHFFQTECTYQNVTSNGPSRLKPKYLSTFELHLLFVIRYPFGNKTE